MSQQPSSSQEIPLEHIDQSDRRFQMRVVTRVSDIKRSLESEHQHEPVELLGPAPYRIIDGFRRCQAATELGWATIRAEVREGLSQDEAFRIAFASNFVRKNLSTLDKANAMRMAMKYGIRKEELPKVFGLSAKQVQRYLDVASLPEAVLAVIDDKAVTMAHGFLLAKFEVGNISEVVEQVRAKGLSARSLKKALEARMGRRSIQGRPKSLYLCDHDIVRVRSTVISLRASLADREHLASQLLELAALLQQRDPAVAGAGERKGAQKRLSRKVLRPREGTSQAESRA